MSHTPGPWTCFYKHKYDEWHVSLPVPGSSMKIALCSNGIESNNREADARLIAAAPDLYAILQRYVASYPAFRIKPVGAPGSEKRVEQENLMALEDAAQAALARVMGSHLG
jgi:hypothetical protein